MKLIVIKTSGPGYSDTHVVSREDVVDDDATSKLVCSFLLSASPGESIAMEVMEGNAKAYRSAKATHLRRQREGSPNPSRKPAN